MALQTAECCAHNRHSLLTCKRQISAKKYCGVHTHTIQNSLLAMFINCWPELLLLLRLSKDVLFTLEAKFHVYIGKMRHPLAMNPSNV